MTLAVSAGEGSGAGNRVGTGVCAGMLDDGGSAAFSVATGKGFSAVIVWISCGGASGVGSAVEAMAVMLAGVLEGVVVSGAFGLGTCRAFGEAFAVLGVAFESGSCIKMRVCRGPSFGDSTCKRQKLA